MWKSQFAFSLFLRYFSLVNSFPHPDLRALSSFKSLSDTSNKLTDWNTSTSLCNQYGLKFNRLAGPIPDLFDPTALKLLFMSYNDFSGDFSATYLHFSGFTVSICRTTTSGQIPTIVKRLTHLLTLRLEENQFFGSISDFNLLNLQDFNVSSNRFTGKVPDTLFGWFAAPQLYEC